MKYNDNDLRRIWDVELEILDVFHKFCGENGLKYSLAFGTLIGAVRHQGFIPWDDDIDIIMPREDYEKFIELWSKSVSSDYVVQNKDTDDDFEQNFTKIRKNHTTFLQDDYEVTKNYHKGIFIDIAPCDRVPRSGFLRRIQYIACAINLLYSKEHTSGTGGMVGFVEKILLKAPPALRNYFRKRAEKLIAYWNDKELLEYICTDTIQNCKRYYPNDLFDDNRLVLFQEKKYFAIGKPDDFLSVRYGDYMALPPEDERVWKHHPIIIDFEHNYEELNLK